MSNLLFTGANRTKKLVSLHNDSKYVKLPPRNVFLVFLKFKNRHKIHYLQRVITRRVNCEHNDI